MSDKEQLLQQVIDKENELMLVVAYLLTSKDYESNKYANALIEGARLRDEHKELLQKVEVSN